MCLFELFGLGFLVLFCLGTFWQVGLSYLFGFVVLRLFGLGLLFFFQRDGEPQFKIQLYFCKILPTLLLPSLLQYSFNCGKTSRQISELEFMIYYPCLALMVSIPSSSASAHFWRQQVPAAGILEPFQPGESTPI